MMRWATSQLKEINIAMTICVAVPCARNMMSEVKRSLRNISTNSQYLRRVMCRGRGRGRVRAGVGIRVRVRVRVRVKGWGRG